ncbi:Os03g0342400, partial [Oryza sativa Japonica Group]
ADGGRARRRSEGSEARRRSGGYGRSSCAPWPPSSSPWARLHGAAVRRHRPGVAVAVHRWLEVPADDAPQSLALLLCRGSGSGGSGSVAGLIPWSSRTPSLRSCSRSVSTLGVPSASWTVVGAGAVTLVIFADVAVALDVVAHTHIHRVQTAACTCVFVRAYICMHGDDQLSESLFST